MDVRVWTLWNVFELLEGGVPSLPLCVCSSLGCHIGALTLILLKHGLWEYEDDDGSLDYYEEAWLVGI